jgi:hypothetical protein
MTGNGLFLLLSFLSRPFFNCAATVSMWLICPMVCDWMRAAGPDQSLRMSVSVAHMADLNTEANLQSLQKVPSGFG